MSRRLSQEELDKLLAHGSWVGHLARRLLYDESGADDVVQEVWLTALDRPPREPAALSGWLAKVARTVSLRANRSAGRRRRNEANAIPPLPPITPEQMEQRFETQSLVASEVSQLDEPYRTIIYLRYYEERKLVDIAEHLGIPDSTVRNHAQRAIEQLRGRLESRFGRDQLLPALAGLVLCGRVVPRGSTSAGSGGASSVVAAGRLGMWLSCVVVVGLCGGVVWRTTGAGLSSQEESSLSREEAKLDPGDRASDRGVAAAEMQPLEHDSSGFAAVVQGPAVSSGSTGASAGSAPTPGLSVVEVLDSEGEPLADARVALFDREQRAPATLATTSELGIALVPSEALARDILVVDASLHTEYREPLSERDLSGTDRYVVRLEAVRDLEVRVVDSVGMPVHGVLVEWIPIPPLLERVRQEIEVVATDSGGIAVFRQPYRRNHVRITADGYAAVFQRAVAPVTEVSLRPGFPAFGRLLDSFGRPVAECPGRVSSKKTTGSEKKTGALSRSLRTDVDGLFDLGHVEPAAELTLEFFPSDLPALRLSGTPTPGVEWEVVVPEGAALSGHVTGPDEKAVAGGFVFFVQPDGVVDTSESPTRLNTPQGGASARGRLLPKARARIRQDGSYELGPVAFSDIDSGFLFVYHPTFQNELVRWDLVAYEQRRDFRLREGVSLTGRAQTVSGAPAAGVALFLGETWSLGELCLVDNVVGRTKTREDGSFRFNGVPSRVFASLGAGVERSGLLLKAFAPSVVLSVDELGGNSLGEHEVDPSRGVELALTVGSESSREDLSCVLEDWRGNRVQEWLPALRAGSDATIHWGQVGMAGDRCRLYSNHEVADAPEWVLVVTDRFRWLVIEADSSGRAVLEPQSQELIRWAVAAGTNASASPSFDVYVGVPFDVAQPRTCVLLGRTDASGEFSPAPVLGIPSTARLFAARATLNPAAVLRSLSLSDDSPDRAPQLQPLGSADLSDRRRLTFELPSF